MEIRLLGLFTALLFPFFLTAQIPAFPSAQGFGTTTTTGGRGGQVIYVTNLNCTGAGSLNAALATAGAKYILFKVSGIIDCAAEVIEGNAYIAGQTAPGGIIVRNVIFDSWYEPTNHPNNVILRHINSRPHEETFRPSTGFLTDDGLRLDGAKNVIVDHCSFANATDESVQISRSNNITIQNCLLAEPIGDHFMFSGMLLNYSVATRRQDSISIHHNLWNRIGGRMPEISCEQSAEAPTDMDCKINPLRIELSNNLLWDIPIQVWFNSGFTTADQEAPDYKIRANFIQNYAVGRSSYRGGLFYSHFLNISNNQLYASGNKMERFPSYSDYEIFYCCNDFADAGNNPNTNLGTATQLSTRLPYPNISYTPVADLRTYMLTNVGAFNRFSKRDSMNRRLMKALKNNSIDPSVIDGVDRFQDGFRLDFTTQPTPPTDTDGDGMPNYWEVAKGLNPTVQDHNGTGLSVALTGIAGYTNLECYLNFLSDSIVAVVSTALPVELVDFTATPKNGQVMLEWKTTQEAHAAYFSVERSLDNLKFESIGSIKADAPNGRLYQVADSKPFDDVSYYRLRQVDLDGTQHVFKVIAIQIKNARQLSAHISNTAQFIDIQLIDHKNTATYFSLTDELGRVMRGGAFEGTTYQINIKDLATGIYFLRLQSGDLSRVEKILMP